MSDAISLDIKKEFIRNQACFSQLTDQEITDLAHLLVEKTLVAGETIVTEGDPVDSVYLIIRGTADVRVASVKDNAVVWTSVATLKDGDSIGLNETGFYSITGQRTATVVALSDMFLLRLSVTEFHGFSLANPHVSEVMRKNTEDFLNSESS